MPKIHPTAIVDAHAELDEGVEIGPYATVEAGARIGSGSVVLAYAYICGAAVLGKGCQIHMGTVVGHVPQDFGFKGERTLAVLGDGVIAREHVTIHRATGEGNSTRIGEGCYLMAGSHVAHNCELGKNVILANGAQLAGHIRIGDRAIVSGNVVIHQFVRIGRLAILSGGSRFGMDVPPYLIGDGTNTVTQLNAVGLRRNPELNNEDRAELKAAFKLLYRSDLDLPQALDRLRSEFKSPAVAHWVSFYSNPSPRGFCRYKATRRSPDA